MMKINVLIINGDAMTASQKPKTLVKVPITLNT